MEKRLKTVTAIIMLVVIAVSTTGCATAVKAGDLMKGVQKRATSVFADREAYASGMSDFAVRLAKTCNERDTGKNVLVSPLSVIMALSMTANGAEDETLREMEQVLGFSKEELNAYAGAYMQMLKDIPAGSGTLDIANSIWFPEDSRIEVNKEFLQTNADYYDASLYSAPFDDTTVTSINNWVSEKTRGMIPQIVNNMPPNAVMFLVNALAFDAEWTEPYKESDVMDGDFWVTQTKRRHVPFMHGDEKVFLYDDNAQGFIKYYKGLKFAFAALLPDEGVDVNDYLNSLDGERLQLILKNASKEKVITSIPKFKLEYSTSLSDVLKEMGMPRAFDRDNAQFGSLGKSDYNIYIDEVLHKTCITLDENGTKAGAAAAVMMGSTAAAPLRERIVRLNRPFVYMLIDTETNTPFFIGVLNTPDPEHP